MSGGYIVIIRNMAGMPGPTLVFDGDKPQPVDLLPTHLQSEPSIFGGPGPLLSGDLFNPTPLTTGNDGNILLPITRPLTTREQQRKLEETARQRGTTRLGSNGNLLLFTSGLPDDFPSRTNMTNHGIVLDLDETLVHSFLDLNKYRELGIEAQPDLRTRAYTLNLADVVTPKGQGHMTRMWGVRRPHLREFLVFCFSYFRIVVVWSAGKYGYVHNIVNQIFGEIIPPHAVLTWNDCAIIQGGTCDKDLRKIYNNPELSRYLRPENTFILDDRTTSFATHTPYNGILIPAYNPDSELDQLRADDTALLQFKAWLMRPEVQRAQDVRTLDKNYIFQGYLASATTG